MTMVSAPPNSGVGVGPNNPAPANLQNSAMANSPSAATAAIPFTRGSTDATMNDAAGTVAFSTQLQLSLQTNAFLSHLEAEFTIATAGNAAAVAFNADAPWNLINSIKVDDPSGQSIMAPISGYGLYLMNKYLPDTGCGFDPKSDPGFILTSGTGATGGSITFRVIIPIETRHRDALGALNNSAANQRYLLTIQTGATTDLYSTPPTTLPTVISYSITQKYWTSPPSVIVSSGGQTSVQQTPSGLGTVAFTRFETHNEVNGGGSPSIQLNNVGDYISTLIFVLRASAAGNARDAADWPPEFDWWVNDFQVHSLKTGKWLRDMARFYGYDRAAPEAAGGLDNGVFVLYQLNGLFDRKDNFGPASQYLPTDATTKLQIRGSTWGAGAGTLQVYSRMIRPVSGAALFA